MALKFKCNSRTEVPAELGQLYVEREGAFVLDVDGVVEKARLDEFRQNNIRLSQEVETLRKKFEGIDPEGARKLAEEKARLEEQLKSGQGSEIDRVLSARLKPLQEQLTAITAEREKLNRELQQRQMDEAVLTAAQKRGLRGSAREDILLRAQRAIRMENGVHSVVDAAGQKRFGGDGVTPLSLDAWVEGLSADAPHLFESNVGGGAAGGGSGGAGSGSAVNPWKRESFNLTLQGKLTKENPALAASLKAAAGVK